MIRIRRGPAPPGLSVYLASVAGAEGSTVTPAQREAELATVFFTDPTNFANEQKLTKKSFTFRIYKHPELMAALEQIFVKKCAYCESRFAHVTPKDIEHFRPKSEIDTGTGKLRPGYYWLAGEWQNLLVSCPDCNRGRKFKVPGQATPVRLGKSTQFPLRNEAGRIRDAGSAISSEDAIRLLIDPCKDQPDRHIMFDDQGLIHPRRDAAGVPSAKGVASITAYALQRKDLVEERLRVLNSLIFEVEQLRRSIQDLDDFMGAGLPASADRKRDEIRTLKGVIKGLLTEDAPYLGMLRGWIRDRKRAGELADLEQAGIDLEGLI